jgi:hypothetical protein
MRRETEKQILEDKRIREMIISHEYWAPRIGWTIIAFNVVVWSFIVWFILYWGYQGFQWLTTMF